MEPMRAMHMWHKSPAFWLGSQSRRAAREQLKHPQEHLQRHAACCVWTPPTLPGPCCAALLHERRWCSGLPAPCPALASTKKAGLCTL